MGRSRGNFHADEDPSQRSRRRRNASSAENLESTVAGQGTGEGKKALYHCNYCNKDITGKIRIKCAVCPDFDLCIECFSVGAEVTPHESNHPYRVMDNLSFPLICPDWNADEEILLLEGIEMYGMGNWAEIAEHVGTKSRQQCIQHYDSIYMNSPYFPLPDMTHVVGKNRKELLAMAKGQGEDKKGLSSLGELTLKEESLFSPSRITIEESHKNGPSGQLLSVNAGSTDLKKTSNMPQVKNSPNSVKVEDHISDSNFGDQKPKPSKDEGPSLMELSGFNAKRQEFDPEYDNEAEQLLAEMDFKETDTEEERELKLRVLHIYSRRLDERKRRKDFILERNLLQPNPFEDLSLEEKDLCRRYDVFMRFHSKEEHDDLLKTVVQEHRIMKRIQELKEAQAAGCRSSDEAIQYFEQKRKREAEESARGTKETPPAGLSIQDGVNGFKSVESVGRDSNSGTTGHAYSTSVTELLSESDKQLCCEIGLPATDYLNMQELMTIQIMNGYIAKKSDAYSFFSKVEQNKIDRIYDMLAKKGLTHA